MIEPIGVVNRYEWYAKVTPGDDRGWNWRIERVPAGRDPEATLTHEFSSGWTPTRRHAISKAWRELGKARKQDRHLKSRAEVFQ